MPIYIPSSHRGIPTPTTKPLLGAQEPYNATADSGWSRTEPLVTPQQVRDRFLLGLPLVSFITTDGSYYAWTDEDIRERIREAFTVTEAELQMRLFPVQVVERHMWDRNLWLAMGYLKLRERPISSIEEVLVCSAGITQRDIEAGTGTVGPYGPGSEGYPGPGPVFINGPYGYEGYQAWATPGATSNITGAGLLYSVPLDWIDVGLVSWGQLNIVPLTTVALSGLSQAQPTTNGGAAFLNLMAQQAFVPQFWLVRYTVGYLDGQIPRRINRYLGIVAAMDILSNLAATNALNLSRSLGVDGLSQGGGTPGPQLYRQRMDDLQVERDSLFKQIRNSNGRRIWVGSV